MRPRQGGGGRGGGDLDPPGGAGDPEAVLRAVGPGEGAEPELVRVVRQQTTERLVRGREVPGRGGRCGGGVRGGGGPERGGGADGSGGAQQRTSRRPGGAEGQGGFRHDPHSSVLFMVVHATTGACGAHVNDGCGGGQWGVRRFVPIQPFGRHGGVTRRAAGRPAVRRRRPTGGRAAPRSSGWPASTSCTCRCPGPLPARCGRCSRVPGTPGASRRPRLRPSRSRPG